MKLMNKKRKAQSLIEYALILAMVTVIAITALQLLGTNLGGSLNNATETINTGGNQVQQNACTAFGGTWNDDTNACDTEAQ